MWTQEGSITEIACLPRLGFKPKTSRLPKFGSLTNKVNNQLLTILPMLDFLLQSEEHLN